MSELVSVVSETQGVKNEHFEAWIRPQSYRIPSQWKLLALKKNSPNKIHSARHQFGNMLSFLQFLFLVGRNLSNTTIWDLIVECFSLRS